MSCRLLAFGRLMTCFLATWAAVTLARGDEPKPPYKGARASPLPKALRESIDGELLPAFALGNPAGLLQAAAPMVRKLDAARAAEVDAYLAEKDKPSLASMLAGARLQLVEQGLPLNIEPPKGRELLATLEGFKKIIDDTLAEKATHAAMQLPAPGQPDSVLEYERLIWDLHVLDNRLTGTQRLVQYVLGLAESRRTVRTDGLTAAQQEILGYDFGEQARAVQEFRQQVAAQNILLRIRRIAFADRQLTESPSIKVRWETAFVLDWDGDLVTSAIQNARKQGAGNPNGAAATTTTAPAATAPAATDGSQLDLANLTAADLNHPQLLDKLRETIAHGRTQAGDDIRKSRMLFTGLHWWFRGRYGVGTEARGLMKNPAALKSPEAMFALYMPRLPPRPTAPGQPGLSTPLVERRHYYLWQLGNETITGTSNNESRSRTLISEYLPGSEVIRTTHFY